MKTINESVAFAVVSVVELKDLIDAERNDDKKDTLKCVRLAFYYLVDNLKKEFGVNRYNIIEALTDNGYDYRMACEFVDAYEDWAMHVIKINERGDNT